MTRTDLERKLKAIAVEQLGVAAEAVTHEAKFIDDLGADSLDVVQLVMVAEEKLGRDVPDEEVEKWVTFGDALNWFVTKLNLTNGPIVAEA